jgi:hypothetical protein
MCDAVISLDPVVTALVPILSPRAPGGFAFHGVPGGMAVDVSGDEAGVVPVLMDEPNLSPLEVIDIALSNLQDIVVDVTHAPWPHNEQAEEDPLPSSYVELRYPTLTIGFGEEPWGTIDLAELELETETQDAFSRLGEG